MPLLARPPSLQLFAVEDHAVQLTWRDLLPGPLRLAVTGVSMVMPSGRYVGGAAALEAAADTATWEVVGGELVLAEGASSGPGSVVLDGLPAGRLVSIRATGAAVGDPIEVTARTLDRLGGSELSRIATLSDLHLGTEVFGQRGTIRERPKPEVPHPERCTEAALDEAQRWGAERILVKGDLTNQGAADHWRTYARLVGAASVPVDALPGNHDHAHPRGRASVAPRAAATTFGLSIADPVLVRDLPGVRVVLVDSTRPGEHGGSVERVAALVEDAVADADRACGVLVALHHQLQPHHLPEGWPSGIPRNESYAFLERLGAAHPHVLVTSGHTHRHRRWGHAGVAVTQVGSTKDYPGVWAGYVVHEGGMRQIVRRVARPDCMAWTDHSRRAAGGMWRHVSPGRLDARCFNLSWHASA